MITRRMQWRNRVLTLLVTWVALTALLAWLYTSPSWPGVLLSLTVLFALVWLLGDLGDDEIARPDWRGWHPAPTRTRTEWQLTGTRRLVELAGQQPTDGAPSRPAAAQVQNLLRRAVAQRAGPESWQEPSSLPDDLAAYLRAEPAPIVPPDRLHTLLTRIEDL